MLVGIYNAQYVGKTMCGFVNKKDYQIEIEKNIYGYVLNGLVNLTDDVAADTACMNYASEKSIRRNWKIEDS